MAEKRRSLLWWLITLPFRPYLRWLTLLVVLVLVGGYVTGHTQLAGSYLFGRCWPLGTPLIEYAPQNASAFVLIDLTRPGAGRLRDVALRGKLKAKIDALADALSLSPRWDVLQVMMAWGNSDSTIIAARGRFTPKQISQSLGSRGYRASEMQGQPLFIKDSGDCVLIRGRTLLLAGSQEAIAAALGRVGLDGKGLDDSEVFDRWLGRVGRRHVVTALGVQLDSRSALGALAGGELQNLEALGLLIDTAGDQGVQFTAALGPRSAAELNGLQNKLSALASQLRAGSAIVQSPQLKPLLANLEVRTGDQVAYLASSASIEQTAQWVDTVDDPRQLASVVVNAMAAGVVGSALSGLGNLLPGGTPPTPASAPSSAPDVSGAIKTLLGSVVDSAARELAGSAPTSQPAPAR